ncbi:MAG: class II glutamine amidotransferase [Lachnospiraceae bacterium]|nr:class II glutamine amidotransferase [Lachnospiraceae bacterium]
MCELFGVTANRKVHLNSLLEEFFSHSNEQPSGWGIATFEGRNVSLEKEPLRADRSAYLKSKLNNDIYASNLFGHIRRATIGYESYVNTHPFTAMDLTGRIWTLIHNGTIFEAPQLSPYQYTQSGTTDSERILLYIVDEINRHTKEASRPLNDAEKHEIIDEIFEKLSPENKLNVLLYDGENMYIHKNAKETLFVKEDDDSAIFSTQPLDKGHWREVEQNRLLVYRNGALVYSGAPHDYSYIEDPQKMKLLFLAFSNL